MKQTFEIETVSGIDVAQLHIGLDAAIGRAMVVGVREHKEDEE